MLYHLPTFFFLQNHEKEYLRIDLTKEVKDLYTENYKTLL
jgi:hypothetical protein